MSLVTPALAKWLNRLSRRSKLSTDDRAMVMGLSGHVKQFATSRDVVKLGELTTHSCLIAEGVVARFGQTADGLRQLSAIYIPGDMSDLHSAVLPRVSAPLQSALRATVVYLPHDELIAAAERSPALARAFWRDCVADAQVGAEWMLNNGRRNARSRLAHLMCELACRYTLIGEDRLSFPLELSQSHLADATSMTQVHVNRSLRALREEGAFAVRDRRGVILDWDRLTRVGEFDVGYLHAQNEGQ